MKLLLLVLLIPYVAFSQEDLLKELESKESEKSEFVDATFKGSRLVNGQSVETRHAGELELIFSHRFGTINSGIYELFGLDEAYIRLGAEYGITDRLSVGMGRTSVDKTYDGYFRYKLIRQTIGGGMPVTISAYGNAAIKTSPRKEDATFDITMKDRMAYVAQLLIARKFSSAFSLQLMPSFVHQNLVDQTQEVNSTFALGAGGRMKVSRSVSLNAEYYYRFNVPSNSPYNNAIGFGIDIETGGHVFQLVLTNSLGMTERHMITETQGNFFDGDIHMGFNITRAFQLKKPGK
ncbi:MAG: DUF5777 family beta-barrel protein [Cyclobacteriaceae bacterium]|nr:DUF5777 family beta-barrel protein [Cyclobacteriaceae bacterium]